jgi:hypothetical protein
MWQRQWHTTPLLINESQMEMQTIKKLHRFTSLQKPQILLFISSETGTMKYITWCGYSKEHIYII